MKRNRSISSKNYELPNNTEAMEKIDFTLIGDGPSDKCLIPVLKWLLRRHFPGIPINGDWADDDYVGSKYALSGSLSDLPLRIGAQSKSLARYCKGKIDDIRICHRVLSSEEIGDTGEPDN